ncbi:MAG: hypothetical protein ACI8Q1_001080 [Parvicella sp.]|jgi:hypothetical protein
MRQLSLFLIIFSSTFFYGQNWEGVGAPGFSNPDAKHLSFSLDNNGVPYIAFSDGSNNHMSTVMKYDGTNWVTVGTGTISSGATAEHDIGFDSNNTPYIVYTDSTQANRATAKQFNGVFWQTVGFDGFTPNNNPPYTGAYFVNLEFNSLDELYVAFQDRSYNSGCTVMKFDGTNWNLVGPQNLSNGTMFTLDFKIDNNDIPYVIYQGNNGTTFALTVVRKFDGTNWVTVGTPGYPTNNALETEQCIAFDSNNTPYIAFRKTNTFGHFAYVMNYDGTNWNTVGTGAASPSNVIHLNLDFSSDDTPYIAYRGLSNGRSRARKFDGTTWEYVGNIGILGLSDGNSNFTVFDIDKNTGEVYVGYQDATVANEVTVKKICEIDLSLTINGNTLSSNETSATYAWLDCDNGFTVISGATNQTYSPAIDGNYSCKITNGCRTDTSACQYICTTSNITTLSAIGTLITADQSGINYQWIDCTTGSIIAGETSQNYSAGQNGDYSCVLTNGCRIDTTSCISITCLTSINPAITVSGDTITVSETGATYQWFDCNTNSAIASATNQSYVPTLSGDYACAITSGCSVDTSICTNICTIQIDISSYVSGDSIYLNESGANYQWLDCNDNYSVISGFNTDSFAAPISGSYACEITQGCAQDTTLCSVICIANLNNTIVYNNGILSAVESGASYQWINCNSGTFLQGSTNQNLQPFFNGDFACIITLGCNTDTSECFNIQDVGISDYSNNSHINLFPNPATESITIESDANIDHYEIYSIDGSLVLSGSLNGSSNQLDVGELSKGVYILKCQGNEVQLSKPFVKE